MSQSTDYVVHVLKKDKFYCYIDELGLIAEDDTYSAAYEKLEKLKQEHLNQLLLIKGPKAIPAPERFSDAKKFKKSILIWGFNLIIALVFIQVVASFMQSKITKVRTTFVENALIAKEKLYNKEFLFKPEEKEKRIKVFKQLMDELTPYTEIYENRKKHK